MDGQRFDALTKSLSSTSRRRALRLLAGGALGGVLAKVGLAEAAAQETAAVGDRCRRNRDCDRNERCCNRRCINVLSDERACGACGNRCGSGETCINGACFRSCRGARPGVCNTNSCGNLCGCNTTFNGGNGDGVCESLRGSCTDARVCDQNTDCRDGEICVNDGCCAGKPRVCARPCATADAPVTSSTAGASRAPASSR